MLLAVDVGNTHTVIAIFRNNERTGTWRLRTFEDATADEYWLTLKNIALEEELNPSDIDGAIISCVVPPLLGALDELCRRHLKVIPLLVGPGIKSGMPIRYDNPKEVGADRIVNAVAAYEKYKSELIAVDFGTATTFDYINSAGEYEGGSIAPGSRSRPKRSSIRLPSCSESSFPRLPALSAKIRRPLFNPELSTATPALWTGCSPGCSTSSAPDPKL